MDLYEINYVVVVSLNIYKASNMPATRVVDVYGSCSFAFLFYKNM